MIDESARAAEALNAITPPSVHDEWLRISMAFKEAGGDYETWDAWNRNGEGYNEPENRAKWDTFKPGAIKAGTLYYYARLAGWMPSRAAEPVYTAPKAAKKPAPAPKTPSEDEAKEREAARAYIAETLNNAEAAAVYLKQRGILSAPEGFKFGWDNKRQALVIVYPEADYYVRRFVNVAPNGKDGKRYEYPPHLTKPVFNPGAFDGETAYLTEGQIDAITLNICGFPAAACNTPAAIKEAIQGREVKTVYYIADDDEQGQKMAKNITAELKAAGITAHIITLGEHDVNALFLKHYEYKSGDDAAAIEAVQTAINQGKAEAVEIERRERDAALEAIEAETVAAHLANIRERYKHPIPPVKTGFDPLDNMLGGGLRRGELTILGGVSSSGKTALAMQIVDHAAAEGLDCIVFSSEMSEHDLVARSVSRESSELRASGLISWDFSQREVQNEAEYLTAGKQAAARSLDAAWKSYTGYSGYITIIQNNGENMTPAAILNQVKEYCETTGRRPLVLVDYLQNLTPEDNAEEIRANTNKAVKALKQMAISYGVPVIAISSLNRENYGKPLNFAAFKESGDIEYSAEVLLGLQFHAVHELEQERQGNKQPEFLSLARIAAEKQMPIRDVEISILKQRGGMPAGYCRFDYDAKHNHFYNAEEWQDDISAALELAKQARAQKEAERGLGQITGASGTTAPAAIDDETEAAPEPEETQAELLARFEKPEKTKKKKTK